jgi:mono/diheme cytochrome c family protein
LTNIAAKRPEDFFGRWLSDPVAVNRHHRMPVFELTEDERISLSMYLAERGDGQEQRDTATAKGEDAGQQIARGRDLVKKLRCGSCHELPEAQDQLEPSANVLLDENSNWRQSCSGPKANAKSGWGYDLPEDGRRWLEAFFRQTRRIRGSPEDSRHLILKNNCLACHAREGFATFAPLLTRPLSEKLAAVAEGHPQLAPLIPAMTPPSLNGVGDKLTLGALKDAIRRTGPPHRSYLLVRMPKFALQSQTETALTSYFWLMDQMPPGAPTGQPSVELSETALAAAGGRLVSTDGFGCVSCHQIGNVAPDKAPLNARGPGLSQIGKRIRREWFDRFVADPSRIVPRMEMPSVRIPVKGVLGDKVDAQLAAVWHVLNTPGFEPPEPNPVRVLRRSGIAERSEPPLTINDVVKLGERTFIHPLVIGLPNRQNFLYDLSEGRLAAWWLGDAARQRTRGKSWHWEPGGPLIVSSPANSPEIALIRDGKKFVPMRQGQHVAQLSRYDVTTDGRVRILYRLELGHPGNATAPKIAATIADDWQFGNERDRASVRRLGVRWNALGGDRLIWQLVPPGEAAAAALLPDKLGIRLDSGDMVHCRGDEPWTLAPDGSATSPPLSAEAGGIQLELTYQSKIVPDVIDSPPLVFSADAGDVEIAPGFAGRRLPLPGDLMPTALAWRKGASGGSDLLAGSLKGQVIAAVDSDGDGLEDAATVVADGLATPYGLHDDGDYLHVLTKSALLGIKHGGVSVFASGWGHTDDYHDWAIGLPRNAKGEYFIGLPCQQDERSAAAAKFRGAVLRLTPRTPTGKDRSRFELHVISTGHRFPMGLALDRDGELFVTDNQGNYNPFNELNHVRQGAFFGFVNANEKKDNSFKAPPLAEPAIDIPHPWTRSVNGICFLDSSQVARHAVADGRSAEAAATASQTAFGPLEGHLIGCEYDTRRLVRMTLQKVGDSFQGAAYPLSLEPSSPEKGFLGPVVCAVSPRGELYVGSIRDSGWGAGNNIGEVVQIKIEPHKLPAGIAEVRAVPSGFAIDFFRAIDAGKAGDAASYAIASYRRESTPAYGGPDLDRRIEKVTGVIVSPDLRRVTLKLPGLREGFVYELQLKNLTADGSLFHPAEAHYTLRRKVL